jgi:hypothetical protein
VLIVLVELEGGEGVVRREDGETVVTDDVSEALGVPLRGEDYYQPVKAWLAGERCLVGGLLAPGAVSVEVVDDRGARVAARVAGGAYAAILEQPMDGDEPVVCCRDSAGDPVRRPIPESYPRVPVLDAREPCPACGSVDYEECVPTESWRGWHSGPGGTMVPTPIVVCCVCGHQENAGAISRYASLEDEDESTRSERLARWRAERRVQRWYQGKITLLAATFPIYAAEGWPAKISGSGSRHDQLTELTIAHTDTDDADPLEERPRIEVTTSIEDAHFDELAAAQQALGNWVADEIQGDALQSDSPELSDAAISLWFKGIDRRRRAAALTASRSEAQIAIDGAEEPFLVLTSPSGRWVAVRRHDDLAITIASRDLEPATITLEPIPDPEARLLGPQPEDP